MNRTIRIGVDAFTSYEKPDQLVRFAVKRAFPEYKIECSSTFDVYGRQAGEKVYLGSALEMYFDVKKTKELPRFCKLSFPMEYKLEQDSASKKDKEKELLITQENWIENQHSYDLMISQAFEDSWPGVFIKLEDFEDGVHVCVYQLRNKEYRLDAGLRSKFIEEIKKLEYIYVTYHPNDFPLKLEVRIEDKPKYWTDVVYLYISEEDESSLSNESVSSVATKIITRKFFKPSFTGTKFSTDGYKDSINRNTETRGCIENLESFLVGLPDKKTGKSVISFPIRFPLIVERKSIAVV